MSIRTTETSVATLRRVGVAGLAVALVGFVAVAVPSATAAPRQPTPVSPDRADLVAVTLDSQDRLSLRLRTADQAVYDPATVALPAGRGTTGTVPNHPAYAFLGDPGDPVWALTSGGTDFPAWDTTGVSPGRLAGDSLDLELVEVDGPGAYHAYTLSPVGEPELLLGTSPGSPQATALPAGGRYGGAIWVFDAPGTYQVTLAASAELASGRAATDQRTYQVEVPGLPADAAPLSTALLQSSQPQQSSRSSGAPAAQAPQPLAQSDSETGEGQVVIDDGHVDIGPRFVEDTWTIQVKDDTVSPHVWRSLHDVVLHVMDEAVIEVPEGDDFGFLGDSGDRVWVLPQAQQAGILWPGWNTEHESVVDGISGETTWTLHGVDGPGEFVLFLTGSFGASEIRFDSQESLPQDMSIPLRTHAHGNWAFTEPGVYHLEFEISATTTGGDQVSDTRILAFAVGDDTDPDTAFPPEGSGNGNGNGDGGGDDNGDGNEGGALSKTGLTLVPLILIGAVLLLGGTVLVLLARRRRAAAKPAGETS